MKKKLTEPRRLRSGSGIPASHAGKRFQDTALHGSLQRSIALAGCFLWILSAFIPVVIEARTKAKIDRFHGTLVAAGPKAVTVKSRDNIYLVRTFSYSPELEKKIPQKKLVAGKKITVHYLRGTDWAVKVD